MLIRKLLIANRGEIALRIIRSCRELGIATVAIHSTIDRNALHVQLADESVCVGNPPNSESYLNIPNILAAALSHGADAIHPGYGFLAENGHFAEICASHGLIFIGPAPESIKSMGDKATARATMRRIGVPTLPGSEGIVTSYSHSVQLAESIGYPIIIKATAGGGGRGIRLVSESKQLKSSIKLAQHEADATFGNAGIYIEKFIERPRHIEVQILSDKHGNVVYLGERDCSIQYRYQKLLEEAPSSGLDCTLRQKMNEAAILAAKSINYEGAGTIEFLVDQDGQFFFIEMNTRIQVEHPITEMVTGIDLVAEQISIASNQRMTLRQEDIHMNGYALECRINAEDPNYNFRPVSGRITGWLPPGGPGVRVDSHVYTGYEIPAFYDSLIGKIIVWAPTRESAIKRMHRALSECAITGIPTTVGFHLALLDRIEFQQGAIHTKFVEQEMLTYKYQHFI